MTQSRQPATTAYNNNRSPRTPYVASPHNAPDHPVLAVHGLSVTYRDRAGDASRLVHAVTDLTLTVQRGQTLALIGESGCGKTTAALAVLGMLPAAASVDAGSAMVAIEDGDIDLLDIPPRDLRRMRWQHISYVPQGSISALNPIQRVGKHFRQTAQAHDLSTRVADQRGHELLAAVHLEPNRIWNSYPHELSGGTKQRVAIALAMLLEPAIIILDEPTTALDVLTQEAVLKTLLELQAATGVSYLTITHDLAVAAAMAHDVVTMYAGRAVEYGTAEQVIAQPIHPYTRGLMQSMPTVDSDVDGEPIGGHPPSLAALPSGCSFHPRCTHAQDACCKGDAPPLVSIRGRQVACPVVADHHAPPHASAPWPENNDTSQPEPETATNPTNGTDPQSGTTRNLR